MHIINYLISLSILYCNFGEITGDLPNGINIYSTPLMNMNIDEYKLGIDISKFLVNSYLTEYIYKYNVDGSQISYLSPINIVLDSIDREFITIINKECIENIKSIINHPNFMGCKNIEEIKKCILLVKELNNRFKGSIKS